MVTPENEQQQADGQSDPVSQDQQTLDAAQGAESAVRYVTQDELTALSTEISRLKSENRGLQGKIDTGLNAIRRDTEERRRREMDQMIADLPEDQQAFARRQAEETAQLRVQLGEAQVQQQPQEQVQEATEEQKQFVKGMGVNPNHPSLRYDLAVSDAQAFMKSVVDAAKLPVNMAPQQPVQPVQPVAVPAQQATQSPPVDGTPGRAVTASTADEYRDLFRTGKIDLPTLNSRLGELGEKKLELM